MIDELAITKPGRSNHNRRSVHDVRRAAGNRRRFEDRLERMRDDSNLAVHELRAPLTVAVGYASLLLDGSLGPGPRRWSEAVELIAEKLATANALVNDLLLLGQLDRESAKPVLRDLDLVVVARAACERAKDRAEQVGATFTFEAEQSEVHALGDDGMVAILVDNLLNNALIYGGSQPAVTIQISRWPGPAISITDHGRGIAPGAKRRIFERFFRVADPSAQPGSGLGLYLCSGLAERQGGSVALDWSELGQGSKFTLRLPGVGAD
jgi:signal transduction histidine kinase